MPVVKRLAVLAACLVLAVSAASAQDGPERTELRRSDLTGNESTEVIMSILEAAPGTSMPRHYHHGDEYLYVLEGGTIQPPGGEPVHMEAGQTLHFPREVPHGGFTVIGDTAIRALTVHVVDKEKPLVELVD